MPRLFAKGNPGKPKGALSAKTRAWDRLGEFFTDAGAERAKNIMMNASDKEFMQHYSNLIELFKPKLSRAEVEQHNTGEQKLVIERTIINKSV
jgi:hypothetical protein